MSSKITKDQTLKLYCVEEVVEDVGDAYGRHLARTLAVVNINRFLTNLY